MKSRILILLVIVIITSLVVLTGMSLQIGIPFEPTLVIGLEEDTGISKRSCMNVYQQSLDNSLHLDEYRKNFVALLTQCNENGYLQDTDVDIYLDAYYGILDMTCEDYAGISPRFTSDLQRYAADIKYDECNPDESWLKFKYGSTIAENEK